MKQRILFNTSKGSFNCPGGGEILLLELKKRLELLGFDIKVLEEENYNVDFSRFGLFHNFNVHRDNWPFMQKAKKQNLKVAISTLYWPSLRNSLLWNQGLEGKAKAVASELLNRLDLFGVSRVGKMVRSADLLLPNSVAEAAVLERFFSARPEKIFVVPNGVDKRFKEAKPGLFAKKFGLRDFVLYVGRIEQRKNVLSLIRAVKGIDETLVVIGGPTQSSRPYFEKCRQQAGKNVVFLKAMPHSSKMLESAFAACKVFCLPSWYETPGLAALEAGLAGSNIVITGKGCTREYFGKLALYVKPGSVADIREKIVAALEKKRGRDLQKHIAENFLWERAAEETAKAYAKVLEAVGG